MTTELVEAPIIASLSQSDITLATPICAGPGAGDIEIGRTVDAISAATRRLKELKTELDEATAPAKAQVRIAAEVYQSVMAPIEAAKAEMLASLAEVGRAQGRLEFRSVTGEGRKLRAEAAISSRVVDSLALMQWAVKEAHDDMLEAAEAIARKALKLDPDLTIPGVEASIDPIGKVRG